MNGLELGPVELKEEGDLPLGLVGHNGITLPNLDEWNSLATGNYWQSKRGNTAEACCHSLSPKLDGVSWVQHLM